MKLREYSAPLTVLGAGVLGFSLICFESAAALTSPMTPNGRDIEAQDIMDSAFSNPISTAVAMTVVEITAYIPSPTSSLVPSSPTISPLGTPTVSGILSP